MKPNPHKDPATRPYVLVNMAMTADGKIATANREVSSFTSRHDHHHLLALRAQADAVMSGARSVNDTAIDLGPGSPRYRRLRLRRGLAEYNLRVVVSGSGSLNPKAQVFRHHFSPIIVLATGRIPQTKLARLEAVADEVFIGGEQELDFANALRWLRRKWKVNRLLCEGGGVLNAALFRAGLVDELHLTIAPKIFGGREAPTIADGAMVASLAQAAQFQLNSFKRVGKELFLTYHAIRSAA